MRLTIAATGRRAHLHFPMKERRFEQIRPEDSAGIRRATELFLTGPHLTREDIRTIAGMIAEDVRRAMRDRGGRAGDGTVAESIKRLFTTIAATISGRTPEEAAGLIRFTDLGAKAFAETAAAHGFAPRYGDRTDPERVDAEGNVLTLDEAQQALRKIFDAIGDDLRARLPDVRLYVASPTHRDSTQVSDLSDGGILKRLVNRPAKDTVTALTALYGFRDRSPHLLYPVVEHSADWSVQIQRRLAFTTLLDAVHRTPKPALRDTLAVVLDAARGADFLARHGLGIGDLALRNVAIVDKTGTGALFDYDTLFPIQNGDEPFVARGLASVLDSALSLYRLADEPDAIPASVRSALAGIERETTVARVVERLEAAVRAASPPDAHSSP